MPDAWRNMKAFEMTVQPGKSTRKKGSKEPLFKKIRQLRPLNRMLFSHNLGVRL